MMKKIVTFSLFIFMSGLFGILIAGFLVSQQQCESAITANGNIQNNGLPLSNDLAVAASASATSTTDKSTPVDFVLSASEVAKHSKASDCWQIVSGKVYNFSSYLNQHPGGAEIIIGYCGQEATSAFSTKGNQGSNHSDFAWKLLGKYLVGDLNQKISAPGSAPAGSQPQTNSQPVPSAPAVKAPTVVQPPKATTPPANSGTNINLTAAELARHSTAGSCWLLVSGKIYDVSSYLSKHPAGAGAITPYCGKESTAGFTGSGGGHVHSSYASGLLSKFYIGTIGQQTTTSAVQQSPQQAQTAAQQVQAGFGDEEEDD